MNLQNTLAYPNNSASAGLLTTAFYDERYPPLKSEAAGIGAEIVAAGGPWVEGLD